VNQAAQVLIVDDSRLYRGAIEEALAGQEGITVTGSVWSGLKALEHIRSHPTDIVTLDLEMPGMDGLETLLAIEEYNSDRPREQRIGVIMVSAYTTRGAQATIRALEAGAFDFIEKPQEANHQQNVQALRQHLTAKIRAFIQQRGGIRQLSRPVAVSPAICPSFSKSGRAVVIGVSTGGPQALGALVPELARSIEQPIFIVQHMPAEFTGALAESLTRQVGRPIVEGFHGSVVQPCGIYVAPGGRHMLLRATADGQAQLVLNQQPPECGCRPSANVLFRSAATVYGGDLIAVVLTGMGCDGAEGIVAVKRAGGHVIVQDEASSVVWGMPSSAIATGQVDEVLPLDQIARRIATLCRKWNG
jgi:two-component system chemotaxis response regulator CheB